MQGGLFLLLCLLALLIGNRARKARENSFTEKEIVKREKLKRFLIWFALILISLFTLLYLPVVFQEINIAIDTYFSLDTFLSILILLFGTFTIYYIVKTLTRKVN